MKIVSRFVNVLGLAALSFGLSPANAQDIQTVSVKFPFAITVGARTLPAGDYTISSVDLWSDAPIFVVRGKDASVMTFASSRTTASSPLTKDDVVVEVTGDKHVLSQIRIAQSDSVYELVRSRK